MSRLGAALLALLAAASAGAGAAPEERLGTGRSLTVEEVRRLSITAFPAGTGLPPGSGTVDAGRQLFANHCAACHGSDGQGSGNFPPLSGGRGSLRSKEPLLTVGSYWPHATTLWDYTRRAMPYAQPGSLTDDEVYALTAYVLFLNGIVDGSAVLDEKTLPQVRMPNRGGFVSDPRPDFTPHTHQRQRHSP